MADDIILKGAYSAEEFADDIEEMREHGLPRGVTTGWVSLDKHYSVAKGYWTVVTGFSSSGKSTWLDNLLVNIAKEHNWKFLICSPENQPIQRHIASLMEIYAGKKFGKPGANYPNVPASAFMTDAEHKEAYKFIVDHFQFIDPPDVDFTVQGIIALAEKVRETFVFDGMVLDPYNEIEHKRPSGTSETDYISWVIKQFRMFTQRHKIHFWFVAHPTKPNRISLKYNVADVEDAKKPVYQKATLFDISGSANWKSKCDFGLIVHRDRSEVAAPNIIEIEKVRFRESGSEGEVAMFYDSFCNRFVVEREELLWNRGRLHEEYRR